MKKILTRKRYLVPFFVTLFLSSSTFAGAPDSMSVLAPDIQKNFDKGLSAAKQKDYELAIRYFNDVFEAVPLYPLAYFNLGLAHANAGHELAAIAWLKAYLNVDPNVSNRAEIEKAITEQEVAAESEARKIISQAEEAALALPDDGTDWGPRKSALQGVFNSMAGMGDLDGAVKFAEKYQWKTYSTYEADAISQYVSALANDKKFEAALELVKRLPDDKKQTALEFVMSGYQYASGYQYDSNLDKAMEVFRMLPNPGSSYYVQSLAEAFAVKGSWNEAIVIAEKKDQDAAKLECYVSFSKIAKGQKNLDKAREFAAKAETLLPPGDNIQQVHRIAEAYVELGDEKKVLKMLETYPMKPDTPGYITSNRAGIYERIGGSKKADEIFATLTDPNDKSWTARIVIEASVKRKDFKRAKSFLPHLTSGAFIPFDIGSGYAELAWGLMKEDKASEAKKIMGEIPKDVKYDQEEYMYQRLVNLASKDRDYKRANEFLEKTLPEGWKSSAVASLAQALIEDKRYEEALSLLEKNLSLKIYAGNESLFNFWFKIMDQIDGEGKREEALRVLDKTANAALTRRDIEVLSRVVESYEKFGDKEHAAQVQNSIRDLKWVVLAKEFENARTYDPSQAYKEIQKNEGQYIPGAMASFGGEYLKALKKIEERE